MDDDNVGQTGHHPFADNLVVLLIAMGSAAFVVSIYHLISICFCNHHITTDQDHHQQQQPPRATTATSSLNHGNSSSLVELIPAHKYHKKKKTEDGDEGGNSTTCAVCLGDFEEGEELRTLPECMHSFHVSCIDMWLYSHTSCPICRASTAPSPAMLQRGPMPDLGSGDHHLNPHHSINMMQVALVQRGIV